MPVESDERVALTLHDSSHSIVKNSAKYVWAIIRILCWSSAIATFHKQSSSSNWNVRSWTRLLPAILTSIAYCASKLYWIISRPIVEPSGVKLRWSVQLTATVFSRWNCRSTSTKPASESCRKKGASPDHQGKLNKRTAHFLSPLNFPCNWSILYTDHQNKLIQTTAEQLRSDKISLAWNVLFLY